ncbi:hypothetical protein AGLY_006716 [Aphis glycines]|uniref:Uncharacterized protein n=1 Tax=Aphis glycines TaxID=307491 RepID=A0A6G0TS16_APHGL|nr:hypothetical protein AGLY_006716 [Aphis glycines]
MCENMYIRIPLVFLVLLGIHEPVPRNYYPDIYFHYLIINDLIPWIISHILWSIASSWVIVRLNSICHVLCLYDKENKFGSGDVTSLDLTRVPSDKVISLPDFNNPNNGPGGTLCLTHLSKSKNPGFGLRRQTYDMAILLILFKINYFSDIDRISLHLPKTLFLGYSVEQLTQ